MERRQLIYRVTLLGSIVNVALIAVKFCLGFIGHSSAMIADAVHSFSDFITDIIVFLFIHISNKPQDKDHDYGHGKYETLATTIIGIILLIPGCLIFYNGLSDIILSLRGEELQRPGLVALIAALISIIAKEWTFRFTHKVGSDLHSDVVMANAWHHRSDAYSSIGTALGISGAIFFGPRWAFLDPLAAMVVSVFIIMVAFKIVKKSIDQLLEKSLPEEMEKEIESIARMEPGVSDLHNLRTRSIGNKIAIEMHVRMRGDISLYQAHEHVTRIEQRIKERYGQTTHVGIHVEPEKVDGQYVKP